MRRTLSIFMWAALGVAAGASAQGGGIYNTGTLSVTGATLTRSSSCRVEADGASKLSAQLAEASRRQEGGRIEMRVHCDARTAAELTRLHVGRKPAPAVELELRDDTRSAATLQVKLDRCFIKSWSTSGAADGRPGETTGVLVLEYERIEAGSREAR